MTDRRFVYKKIEKKIYLLINNKDGKDYYDILEKDFNVSRDIVEEIYKESLLSVYKTIRHYYKDIDKFCFKSLLLREFSNRIWDIIITKQAQDAIEFLNEENQSSQFFYLRIEDNEEDE
jgi:hypothetical protein